MTTHKYIFILFISISSHTFAQKETINFDSEINYLNNLGKEIIGEKTDIEKNKINNSYKSVVLELILNIASFDYNFDSLKTMSVLKNGNLKIYNWALPLSDGAFEYFAFLQIRKSKTEYEIIELIDKSDEIKAPETKVLTDENWYGSLYYKIIHSKKLGENYYTLLGWDGNNNLTNKKIIDVVNISNISAIKFGAPIFKTKTKIKKRVIFEYSENAVMSLKYHKNLEKIVFDFLVPESSKLKGIYEYYGPSLNRFDAFTVGKGKWLYDEDIEIELDRTIKDFMWVDPKGK